MQWTEALWLRQLSGAVRTLGKHVKENTPKEDTWAKPQMHLELPLKWKGGEWWWGWTSGQKASYKMLSMPCSGI